MATMLDGYGLQGPRPSDAIAQMARVLGPDAARGAWADACEQAGVDPRSQAPTLSDLLKVAELLSKRKGLVGVVGNSLWIRVQTYELLSRKQRLAGHAGVRA